MVKFGKIAASLLGKKNQAETEKGLYASLDELMEQRHNVRFLKLKTKLNTSQQAGDVKSAFKGRGIEMEEIRAYSFGDDVRDIDWRVTARKNAPYTKIYAEEKDREIYVVLDLSPSMVFGTKKELKSVTAAKTAALLGWMVQENNDRFGVFIFDGTTSWQFKPQQNRAQLLTIFKKISTVSHDILYQQNANQSLKRTLQMIVHGLKSRAVVFFISDFADFGNEEKKLLAALAKKTQLFCLNVFDVLEAQAPAPAEYMAMGNGQTLVFDSRSKAFQEEYSRFFARKRAELSDFCHKFNCHYLEIRTDIPITQQLKTI